VTTKETVNDQREANLDRLLAMFPGAAKPRRDYDGNIRQWMTVFTGAGYYMVGATTMHEALRMAGTETTYHAKHAAEKPAMGVAVADLDEGYIYPIEYAAVIPDGEGDTFDNWTWED
jgi:hypothetical protein